MFDISKGVANITISCSDILSLYYTVNFYVLLLKSIFYTYEFIFNYKFFFFFF